jgi:hypothetical protein
MQDSATAHTAIYFIHVLNTVFEDKTDKLQIVAFKVSRLKSLWFSSVRKSK